MTMTTPHRRHRRRPKSHRNRDFGRSSGKSSNGSEGSVDLSGLLGKALNLKMLAKAVVAIVLGLGLADIRWSMASDEQIESVVADIRREMGEVRTAVVDVGKKLEESDKRLTENDRRLTRLEIADDFRNMLQAQAWSDAFSDWRNRQKQKKENESPPVP